MLGRILVARPGPPLAEALDAMLKRLGVEAETPPERIHDDLDWPCYLGAIVSTSLAPGSDEELHIAVARVRQFRPDLPIALVTNMSGSQAPRVLTEMVGLVTANPMVMDAALVCASELSKPHCFPLLRGEGIFDPGLDDVMRCHFGII